MANPSPPVYLLNPVDVIQTAGGPMPGRAGMTLNDAATIASAVAEGGQVWPTSAPAVAAAVALVPALRAKGVNEQTLGNLMMAAALNEVRAAGPLHAARAVSTANVAALTGAATVDGVVLAAGDNVLLAGQTTASQNGLWKVQAGAWVRLARFAAGTVVDSGTMCTVGPEGTAWANSEWKLVTTAPVTVDTTSQVWYPRLSTGTTAAAVAGVTPSFTGLWVLSASLSVVTVSPKTPGGTQGVPRISTQTAGIATASSVVVTSSGGSDTSTFTVACQNW